MPKVIALGFLVACGWPESVDITDAQMSGAADGLQVMDMSTTQALPTIACT